MRDLPEDLNEHELRRGLEAWGIGDAALTYAPLGFGDYHWTAAGDGGRRWFVTVADLASKSFLGDGPQAALEGLRRAMDTAAALRDHEGLDFVVAPLPGAHGETVRPLGPRYALSVFPYVDGRPGDFDQTPTAAERGRVIDLLATLHRQPAPPSTPVLSPELSMQRQLEEALAVTGQAWRGGPFAEPTRNLMADGTAGVHRRLKEFDRLVEELREERPKLVVTHGEPHPGNLVWVDGRHLLVDWDTVGLAVPERDLWSVATEPDDLERYAEAAGRTPDPAALALYRLRWDLEDLTVFVDQFRAPHERTPDTEQAWDGLAEIMERLTGDN